VNVSRLRVMPVFRGSVFRVQAATSALTLAGGDCLHHKIRNKIHQKRLQNLEISPEL
jgi:hypothetical protein